MQYTAQHPWVGSAVRRYFTCGADGRLGGCDVNGTDDAGDDELVPSDGIIVSWLPPVQGDASEPALRRVLYNDDDDEDLEEHEVAPPPPPLPPGYVTNHWWVGRKVRRFFPPPQPPLPSSLPLPSPSPPPLPLQPPPDEDGSSEVDDDDGRIAYDGTIVSWLPGVPGDAAEPSLWRVHYDDRDEEDLEEKEARPLPSPTLETPPYGTLPEPDGTARDVAGQSSNDDLQARPAVHGAKQPQ